METEQKFMDKLESSEYIAGFKKPILIRVCDFIDFLKEAESMPFMVGLFKSSLKDNLIDKKPIIKGKNINDVYLTFHNNEQVTATIEILKDRHYLFTQKKAVIIPEL